MIYIDYVILRQSYEQSDRRLRDLQDKKEEAFTRTLPNSIRYDLVRVMHSPSLISPLDEYVSEVEELDRKLKEAWKILWERYNMLMLKEQELRQSKDVDDRIFVMYYLERFKVLRIGSKVGYSKEAVYYHKSQMEKAAAAEGISLEEMFNRK